MIQSFLVYGIFSVVIAWLGNISAKREKVYSIRGKITKFWVWDIVLALVIFAFISGIRWQVGVDHLSYLEGYERIKSGYSFRGSGIEFGFAGISKIFASLNAHFSLYFSFWAFLQLFFIFYAVKDERYLLPYLGIIIILGGQYLLWMNGIRQMVAATIFVFSIKFIQNRKILNYLFIILLAAAFHKSALLLIIFYFIPQRDFFTNRFVNLGLILITIIIGQNPQFIQTFNIIEKLLSLIGYNQYAENLEIFIQGHKEMALGPRRIVILLLNIYIVWYSPRLKHTFQNTNFLIYFNLTFIGILLHNLLANTGHLFLRPVSYFTIFLTLTTAYLLYYLEPKEKFKVSRSFVFVLILSISYTFLSVIADYGKGDLDWSNFKFFWDYV